MHIDDLTDPAVPAELIDDEKRVEKVWHALRPAADVAPRALPDEDVA